MELKLPDMSPILDWYRANARKLPWRRTRDPYRIWVSEIMLQQTRVEAVLPYYHRFLARLPDIAALADCPEGELMKLWEGLGYYSRVRNMQKAAKGIMSQYGGAFPQNFEQILSLPGIGEYTAGAIASFAFDLPYPAVDGNVLRVAARLLAFEEDVLAPASKKALTAAVWAAQSPERAATYNQAVIELGATVCLPNGTPKCEVCPLAGVCRAREQGLQTVLPVRKKPTPRKVEERTVLILREGDRVALRQRPSSGLLASLFEPFSLKGRLSAGEVMEKLTGAGLEILRVGDLGAAKHIFTHVEWQMQGYEVILCEKSAETGLKKLDQGLFFVRRYEIDEGYAVPSAYSAYRPFM
ncbi:MAG: A/G-specific adenine glycosylase [Ruminococcaceae bacterium]|nr:A/G-specific adenine glycosylase [Oscillospiraceae bacterium]